MRTYQEQTVELCTCATGHFNPTCPYSTPEEEEYNNIRITKKLPNFEEMI